MCYVHSYEKLSMLSARLALVALVLIQAAASGSPCGPDPFIVLGAPPDKGWKPVREPKFLAADQYEAESYFSKSNPIEGIGAFVNGVAKFYPLDILQYHLIVSDGPYVITFSPLTKTGLIFTIDPWGSNTTRATGCLFMSDLLISLDAENVEWSPTLAAPVVINGLIERNITFTEVSATIIEWRLWKSFSAGGSLVLSRDTGPGLKYYNNPMYTKYYSTDDLLFPSPFTFGSAPYDLDKPKSTTLVVNVTGDIRLYPAKSLHATSGFTIVKQGGADVGIFSEFRSAWMGALIFPPGRNISVDYESVSVSSSLILVDVDKQRWNLWGSPVDATGRPLESPAYAPLQRPHQFSMLFFAATAFFGSRPILAFPRGSTDCWDLRPVQSAETVLGLRNFTANLGSCVNVDRSSPVQGEANDGPPFGLIGALSVVFFAALAAVAAIFVRRRLRRSAKPEGSYAKVIEVNGGIEDHAEMVALEGERD